MYNHTNSVCLIVSQISLFLLCETLIAKEVLRHSLFSSEQLCLVVLIIILFIKFDNYLLNFIYLLNLHIAHLTVTVSCLEGLQQNEKILQNN